MSDLFLFVFNRSVAAGWVILAVILARLLLRRAPKSFTCGLWWIVGARLLSAGFPQASFSLIPSTQTITPQSLFDREPVVTSGVELLDRVVNPVYTESFRANAMASVNPLQILIAVAANIWLLVMIGMWIYALVSWLRLRRRVAPSICLRDNILICDAIDTPFILGLIRPRIYLPSSLDEGQQRHVIAHEQSHIRRLDYWYKPLAYLALTMNWFNPLMWVGYILLCRDIELACDERVIRDMSAEEKKGYSSALLDCSIHRRVISACPLAFGEVGVKERVRAVLHYKKPAFWVILIAVVICAAFVVFFMTDPVSALPEIRWGGALYVQEGNEVYDLPDKIQSSGTLRSTLHDSTTHPTEEGQSIGLDWEYAGQPVYLVGNALYLENPGGGSWLKFQMRSPQQLLSELLKDATVSHISVRSGDCVVSEELIGDRGVAMSLLLDALRQVDYTPVTESSGHVLSLGYTRSGESSPAVVLYRDQDANWALAIQDPEYGQSIWQFECEELEEKIRPYLDRAEADRAVYSDGVKLAYQTFTTDGIYLRVGIPEGWEAEELGGSGYFGLRFRDREMNNGWITVKYRPNQVAKIDYGGIVEAQTFRSGMNGSVCYLNDDDCSNGIWDIIWFYGDGACMSVEKPENYLWDQEYFLQTLRVVGSLSVIDNGQSMFTGPDLGVHLSVENPTPSSLTLITTQDGTPWNAIYTGSYFNIARWYEEQGEWALLPQRDGTAWTMEAYGVPLNETTRTGINWQWIYGELEPGRYRIYKSYTGERGFLADREQVDQTCYAEFTIE